MGQLIAVFEVFPVSTWLELFFPVFPLLFFPRADLDWAFVPGLLQWAALESQIDSGVRVELVPPASWMRLV